MNDDVRANYEAVCNELNIDEIAKDSAWKEYQSINNDYVLEGPHIEWLACALYIACRSSVTKTVEGEEYTGNSISLTQILRATKLRLIEFFRKIKKWLEMAKLPPLYLDKVEALERKFEVISVIFNKYTTEYSMLFVPQDHSQPTLSSGGSSSRPRSRKPNKAKPCSSSQLFQFGWVLYIHIKNQFPLINDDLVNSHYLLLCCLDMLCTAVISMKRKDLLNPLFNGDSDSSLFPSSSEFPQVLSELCKKFAAIEKECLVVRDYYWWPSVRRLYESRTLHWTGSLSSIELQDVLQSLLSPASFHSNLKSLNHVYELTVLQEGDFDERVFLNNPSDMECYQRESEYGDNTSAPPGIIYQSPQHLQYSTPLTNREYLSSKDSKLTPVSDANQSVIQLHMLLEGYSHTPSDELIKICSCCHNNPMSTIDKRLQEMSQKFLHSLKADSSLTPDNFAVVRLQLSQSLYYKLLTAIVCDEEKKMAGSSVPARSAAIQNMLEHDIFQQSLFALCVEIVLFSYNSHSRIFPWILSIIEVGPFHFYKVIEVAIKVETGFPRTVIKHMSKIEESVLSSLAWKTGSPLFEMLEKVGSIPCYSDVALPDSPIGGINSPLTSRLKMSTTKEVSPLSVRERYSSPVPSVSRRQLFTGKRPPKSPAASPLKVPLPIAPKPPQGKVRVTRLNPIQNNNAAATAAIINLIQQQTSPQKSSDPISALQAILASKTSPDKKPVKDEAKSSSNGQENNLPKVTVSDTPQKAITSPLLPPPTRQQPKRTGSVALFYRKVYQMSFLRIKDLCERLNLDTEMLQKVWTCFEYSLMRSPDLMRDRHIDQLIMCSIYVVAKVLRKDVTFQEIMRQYRHQPQAKSHVYRSVLLNSSRSRKWKSKKVEQATKNEEPMDTTAECSTTSDIISEPRTATPDATVVVMDTKIAVARDLTNIDAILFKDDIDEETRGDIIQFYNKLFIGFVKDYVLKFTPDENVTYCSMSPLPLIKRAPVSPRKVSKNHPIFVSPLKGSNQSSMSPLAKTFVVSKSPASDLFELNQVVGSSSHGARIGARRQLDSLLSKSPVVSNLAQRPCLEVNSNSRHVSVTSSTSSRYQLTNDAIITNRTCNGSLGSNSSVPSSGGSLANDSSVPTNHT